MLAFSKCTTDIRTTKLNVRFKVIACMLGEALRV